MKVYLESNSGSKSEPYAFNVACIFTFENLRINENSKTVICSTIHLFAKNVLIFISLSQKENQKLKNMNLLIKSTRFYKIKIFRMK